MTIRVKEELTDRELEKLKNSWIQQKISVSHHPYLSYAGSLTRLEGLRKVPGFEEGAFADSAPFCTISGATFATASASLRRSSGSSSDSIVR